MSTYLQIASETNKVLIKVGGILLPWQMHLHNHQESTCGLRILGTPESPLQGQAAQEVWRGPVAAFFCSFPPLQFCYRVSINEGP